MRNGNEQILDCPTCGFLLRSSAPFSSFTSSFCCSFHLGFDSHLLEFCSITRTQVLIIVVIQASRERERKENCDPTNTEFQIILIHSNSCTYLWHSFHVTDEFRCCDVHFGRFNRIKNENWSFRYVICVCVRAFVMEQNGMRIKRLAVQVECEWED